MVGPGGGRQPGEQVSAPRVLLKPMLTYGEEPGDSHPIVNEWGGAWVVSRQVRGFLSQSVVNVRCNVFSMSPKLSLI
jgi:hypothetical protein